MYVIDMVINEKSGTNDELNLKCTNILFNSSCCHTYENRDNTVFESNAMQFTRY